LEEDHYSVNGNKYCLFSAGQDINQEEYSVVINHSDVLGINDVILNPERKSAFTDKGSTQPFCRNATTHELDEGRKDRNLILQVMIFYSFRSQ